MSASIALDDQALAVTAFLGLARPSGHEHISSSASHSIKVSSRVCLVSSAAALEIALRHASQTASFPEGTGVLTQAVVPS